MRVWWISVFLRKLWTFYEHGIRTELQGSVEENIPLKTAVWGFILMRQEDSDFYKSESSCRQPVRAAKILTIQKSDDKM